MNGLIIDCFAGGGGASVGIEMALGRPVDIAINHDPQAIRMHKTNHPHTLHLTEDIFKVDLEKYVHGQHVALMWASPDCTSHSKAKGGQPRKQGLRILPWAVYKHTRKILPDVIIMENVEEIQQWGPLDENGRPIPERKGEEYQKFIESMKSLGYDFDSRELVAADYGAPTTRKRWYAIFRRDGKPIVWPEPTHSKTGTTGRKWLECGDYIDLSDLGKSIFDREKPLADATMKRIANGYIKYVVNNPHPYIVKNKNAVAFLIQYHGEQKDGESRGQLLTEPIKTIDTSNRYGLVTAFVTKFYKSGTGQGCDEPLHTITTSPGHFEAVSVFLERYYDGSNRRNKRTDRKRNNSSQDRWEILENCEQETECIRDFPDRPKKNGSSFEIGISGSSCVEGRKTVSSIGAQGDVGIVCRENSERNGYQPQKREKARQQFEQSGSSNQKSESQSCDKKPTEDIQQLSKRVFDQSERIKIKGNVIPEDREGTWHISDNCLQGSKLQINGMLIKYYGTGCGQELSAPLGTITTKDRFGLVSAVTEISGEQYILKDIFLRMLKPEELKLMQGFPEDYIIDRDYRWRKYPVCEQVKRIGNSVVPIMAKVLVKANCPYLKVGERQPTPVLCMRQDGQVAFRANGR